MFVAFEFDCCTLFAQAGEGLGLPESILASPLTFIAMAGLLFYFMVLKPDRKKRHEHAGMLSSLKKNDRVITIGGIFGTVVNAQKGSDELVLKVDESSNTKLRVQRSAISRLITADDAAEKSKQTTS